MRILNGRKLAEKILERVRKEIKKSHLKLRLTIIQVGENPVSGVFIKQKKKACEKTGIDFRLYKFEQKIAQKKLKTEVEKIIKNPKNSGVIIQLPLPKNRDTDEILNLIPLKKDIDVLAIESLGKFYQGTSLILPPVVGAVSHLLKDYKIKIRGKGVVLIGAGRLVGQPLASWILREKGTLVVVNEFTRDIPSFTKKADILISGVGKPNLIQGKMVQKGVIVIDCGSVYHQGKFAGDVDFQSVSKKAGYITPVPGGIGPLTVACLIENLIRLNS
ncbi:bifunctional 5,10-methylenetetrahydrofolate dehydrogenase/5,10-methenyltetrahydrofolate cyclohydrolase [Patescibacteria group bacterium]|nr:bifunctional 5,10-methylenetetrahydrofolate dehydrogenase/5,10-methenyltetrahydrofolate cyclohydrolase [Patescibacteria group bacterium]